MPQPAAGQPAGKSRSSIHPLFVAAGLWEVARFLLLLLLLTGLFQNTVSIHPGGVYWLILLGAGNLFPAFLFLVLGLTPHRNRRLVMIAAMAKSVSLFPLLIVMAFEWVNPQRLALALSFLEQLIPGLTVLVIILGLDLLFLVLLLSFKGEAEVSPAAEIRPELPEGEITEIAAIRTERPERKE